MFLENSTGNPEILVVWPDDAVVFYLILTNLLN